MDYLPGNTVLPSEEYETNPATSLDLPLTRKVIILATNEVNDQTLFINGLTQNIVVLYHLFESLGYRAYLLQHSVQATEKKAFIQSYRTISTQDMVMKQLPIHAFIEIGMSLDSVTRGYLRTIGTKIVKLYLGNILNIDIETIQNYSTMFFNHHIVGEIDEIWTSPHYKQHVEYAALLNRTPIENSRVVPYVWDSCFMTQYGNKEQFEWIPPTDWRDVDVVIVDPNISFQKCTFYSLLLVEAFSKKYPEWRGKVQVVSHRTSSLCMGHGPVIEYLAAQLANLANNGLTWLLHDFETISRCDSALHDHPQGLGEDWAVRGWYRLLSEFRAQFSDVWIENCWNGGRPLDLQMIAHHDTTIGDDWCDVRHNAVAKVGLGQYLPAHWCSSYMSDQNSLTLRSQLAIYAVGGPWILMGDIPNWSDEKLKLAKRVIEVYRTWRSIFPEGSVRWAELTGWQADARWRADQEVLAISFVHESGKELMACVVTEQLGGSEIRWHPVYKGAVRITDEFTGETRDYDESEIVAGIAISTSSPDGHLLSAVPITTIEG